MWTENLLGPGDPLSQSLPLHLIAGVLLHSRVWALSEQTRVLRCAYPMQSHMPGARCAAAACSRMAARSVRGQTTKKMKKHRLARSHGEWALALLKLDHG